MATSIVGVWQGVPYLFADYVGLLKGKAPGKAVSVRSRAYRGYALFMTLVPIPLLFLGKPVWLIVAYAAVGALFMPFLAATLLYMNNQRKRMGALKNGIAANAGLVLSLGLFVFLAIMKIIREIL